MKLRTFFRADSKTMRRIEIAVLPVLVALAVYLWTGPIRAERALRTASFEQLLARSKREPENPRVFYYLGLRLRELGHEGPARAAFERACSLDRNDEDSWMAWSSTSAAMGFDQEAFSILKTYLQAHPRSARAHYSLALLYHAENVFGNAYTEALEAARLNPRDLAAWRLAGTEAMMVRHFPQAEAALRKAVEIDPRDWRAQLALGDALFEQGRDKEAIPCCREAVRLAPDQAKTWYSLGRSMLRFATAPADVEAARQRLLRAISLAPQYGYAWLALGQSEEKLNRWSDAQEALERAKRMIQDEPGVYFELRRVYLRQGRQADADREDRLHRRTLDYKIQKFTMLSHLDQVKENDALRLKLARLCAAHGDYAEAAHQYKRLIARSTVQEIARKEMDALTHALPQLARPVAALPMPSDESAAQLSTTALLQDADSMLGRKRYSEAERAYRNILARDPKSALAYQGLGLALDAQGRREEAFQVLNRALGLNPNLPEAEFTVARLYFEIGFPDEARRRMEKVVAEQPNNAKYQHALGLSCSNDESRTLQAEEAMQKAVVLAPNRPDYLRDLAAAEAKAEHFERAESHYRKALSAAPDDTTTRVALGTFLLDHRPTAARLDEAEHLLQQARQANGQDAHALLASGRLALQRGDAKAAVPLLEAAVVAAPSDAQAWYHLARAHERLGNHERAENCRAAFRDLTQYTADLGHAEEMARTHLSDAALRLKLARLYARGGQYARSINQYQVCLRLDSKNGAARKELDQLVQRLTASGKMPSMAAFNGMLLASVPLHDKQ